MRLLHCNVEQFKYFDEFDEFVTRTAPDVISIMEATNGKFVGEPPEQRDYLGELCEKHGYSAVYHPTVFRDYGSYTIGIGTAVLSKLPIEKEFGGYLGGEGPSILQFDDILFSKLPKYDRYPYSWLLHLPLLSTLIRVEDQILRVISVHFHVSYECLETLQIWQDAQKVANFYCGASHYPTILTGDLNIRTESKAIETLKSVMHHETGAVTNSLSRKVHPLFAKDPEHPGLGVDHIFTSGVDVQSCEVKDEHVSDHLPFLLDFSLPSV